MKKSFIVLIHLGFWACYFLLVFIVLAVYSRSGTHVSDQEGRVMTAFYSILLFARIKPVYSALLRFMAGFYEEVSPIQFGHFCWFGVLFVLIVLAFCALTRYTNKVRPMPQNGERCRNGAVAAPRPAQGSIH